MEDVFISLLAGRSAPGAARTADVATPDVATPDVARLGAGGRTDA